MKKLTNGLKIYSLISKLIEAIKKIGNDILTVPTLRDEKIENNEQNSDRLKWLFTTIR